MPKKKWYRSYFWSY